MRLGGPIFESYKNPDEWIQAVRDSGYQAAYCPVEENADDNEINAYANIAEKSDVVIAEVGAWSNPLSQDKTMRSEALNKCKMGLELADKIAAKCCVNLAGSKKDRMDAPCKEDLSDETFEMIVETVREIIDSVRPRRTFYTLETMPWRCPDSADEYVRLLKAVDRKAFAAHFDPVNLINSPRRFFNNGEIIREFVGKLGPYIKSCHAKDIVLSSKLTVHLDEVRPGQGELDYRTYLNELAKLDSDMPLMMEHLSNNEEYQKAAAHIRCVARQQSIHFAE